MTATKQPEGRARTGILADLSDNDWAAIEVELERLALKRGDILMRQNEEADALFIVVSGRFAVTVEGRQGAIAEIGPGSPVGEIAFLAGGKRTATVTAVRDSLVVRLERQPFERLCQRVPRIWERLTATLARRLADETAGRNRQQARAVPRTIAVIRAGTEPVPEEFLTQLGEAFVAKGRSIVVRSSNVSAIAGTSDLAGSEATQSLNALESAHDTVLYIADQMLTAWTEKAIRQADLVLRVGFAERHPDAAVAENGMERIAARLVAPAQQRLVLVHPRRVAPRGTRHWLENRKVAMHHHAALGHAGDVARLVRFVMNDAIGLVACGGGAFCAAHIGLYKALVAAGVTIDIMGGTSGGSAMAAAFAMGLEPGEIDAAIHDIFIARRALRRYTVPRYAILDHTQFDRLLVQYFGGVDIEDLWIPFFAMSTNLSSYGPYCHRRGKLWLAVRSSGSIPGLLPPCYTEDGQMLVDGALVENVPVAAMCELKGGPNIVLAFQMPQLERFNVDYASLPSRGAMIRRLMLPFAAQPLPSAPSLGSVLMRSLVGNRQGFDSYLGANDLLLVPPLPEDMGILDWGRHTILLDQAFAWANGELARHSAAGHAVLADAGSGKGSAIVRIRPTTSTRRDQP